MSCRCRVFTLSLPLILAALVCADEVSIAPRHGVLLLRNGSVLQGDVIRLGDRFMVSLGGRAEIFVASDEVELYCGDLEEAYRFKRDALLQNDATQHLRLARWCLRHGLPAGAAEQLQLAKEIDPRESRVSTLERQLQIATRPVLPRPDRSGASRGDASSSTIVSSQQIQRELAALPPRVVERFTVSVQPILQNRCSNAACHGARSISTYRLMRPPPGTAMMRRFTQRNLHATLATIDRTDPENSPLLTVPLGPHGTASTAIFSQREHRQYEQLLAWVDQLTQLHSSTGPRTTAKPNSLMLQSTGTPLPVLSSKTALPAGRSHSGVTARSTAPLGAVNGDGFVPQDPFDAEIFNRRYHRSDDSSDNGATLEPSSGDFSSAPAPPRSD